jgi:hypothetical protein
MRILVLSTALILGFTSCFRKRSNEGVFVNFDDQKAINVNATNILFDPNAFSGLYLTQADSLVPYSFTIYTNAKLLSTGSSKTTFKISAQIKRAKITDKASIDFQLYNKIGEVIFSQSIFINENNFTKDNEWATVEGLVTLPNDVNIKDPENLIKIFLFCTKNRVYMDDLRITCE